MSDHSDMPPPVTLVQLQVRVGVYDRTSGQLLGDTGPLGGEAPVELGVLAGMPDHQLAAKVRELLRVAALRVRATPA